MKTHSETNNRNHELMNTYLRTAADKLNVLITTMKDVKTKKAHCKFKVGY